MTVATVDAQHVRVRALAADRWSTELSAPRGIRFVDVSLPAKAILQERADGRRSLISLEHGRILFPGIVAKTPWARLSEDGTKLLEVETTEPPAPGLEVPWFLDLRTGKKNDIWTPATISDAEIPLAVVWHRRNALQIAQPRVLTAFFDIRRDDKAFLRVADIWDESHPDSQAKLLGADVDNDLRTVVVAKSDGSDEEPTMVEIYRNLRHLEKEHDARATARWPLEPATFRALWLSPTGRRLILRTQRHGKITNAVWNTDTGEHLGDLPLHGDCFDFSPDGRFIGEKRGDKLAIFRLP